VPTEPSEGLCGGGQSSVPVRHRQLRFALVFGQAIPQDRVGPQDQEADHAPGDAPDRAESLKTRRRQRPRHPRGQRPQRHRNAGALQHDPREEMRKSLAAVAQLAGPHTDSRMEQTHAAAWRLSAAPSAVSDARPVAHLSASDDGVDEAFTGDSSTESSGRAWRREVSKRVRRPPQSRMPTCRSRWHL
jgi:hypothetical protein